LGRNNSFWAKGDQGLFGAVLASVDTNVGKEMPTQIALKAFSGFHVIESAPLQSIKRSEMTKYGHLR